MKTEREQFNSFRDKNKDGKMDRSEVMEWIIPPDYDHSEAEAKHLMHESDADRVCLPCLHRALSHSEHLSPTNSPTLGHL